MRHRYRFFRRHSGCDLRDGSALKFSPDAFCWTNDTYMLCYFRPDIGTSDDDNILDLEIGDNKIISFGYHMRFLVCRSNKYEKDSETWETLIDAAAYDFPNVRQLREDIRTILNSDMEDAQIVRDNCGEPYEKVLCLGTEGAHVEDGYVISRIKRYPECDMPDRYELEIGTNCQDIPGSAHFYRLIDLNREDIRCLYTCVTRFIEYAEDWYNLGVKSRWENAMYDKKIDGEVLMCFKGSLTLISEGEKLASIKYWDHKGEKLITLYNIRISAIDGDSNYIVLENGEMIGRAEIYSVDGEFPGNEILTMGVEAIAEDFCDSILVKTVTMLDDFESMEVSELYEKYGEYIENRYYMCRDEHGFEMPEDVMPVEGVKPYVEEVIRLLKSKI